MAQRFGRDPDGGVLLMHALLMTMGGSQLSLDGVLTTTSGTSPVTSATRTVRGNGTFEFSGVASDGGAPFYSLNGAGYLEITEAMTLAVVNGDTLAVRATLSIAGYTATFTLGNNATGQPIEAVTLTRS